MPYNHKNVLSVLLNKTFPSFLLTLCVFVYSDEVAAKRSRRAAAGVNYKMPKLNVYVLIRDTTSLLMPKLNVYVLIRDTTSLNVYVLIRDTTSLLMPKLNVYVLIRDTTSLNVYVLIRDKPAY